MKKKTKLKVWMAQEKSIFLQHTDSLVFMRRGKKTERISFWSANKSTKVLKSIPSFLRSRTRRSGKKFSIFICCSAQKGKSTNFPTIELRNDLRRVNSRWKSWMNSKTEKLVQLTLLSASTAQIVECILLVFYSFSTAATSPTPHHNRPHFSSQQLFRSCDFLLIVYQFCITAALTISSLPPWHT